MNTKALADRSATAPRRLECRACSGVAECIFVGHPAFRAPATFDVYHCDSCDTRFAWPMQEDPSVYELIYGAAAAVPGYARYQRYAEHLRRHPDPLGFLAGREDVYWSIRKEVAAIAADKSRPLRILEVGSGFGYLTYALNKAGHTCQGIDVSERAVTAARRAFGDYYSVSSGDRAAGLKAMSGGGGFDVIVATEVIEHVVDPREFLATAAHALAPDGRIILTTPNKDLYSQRLAWHTDPAPVHFWWFSATSIRRLAWSLGMNARFTDFSAFYRRATGPFVGLSKPQTFDESGAVVHRDNLINTAARWLLARFPELFVPIGRMFVTRQARIKANDAACRFSLSLCAVLAPKFAAEPLAP